jgi:hypothetical protein
MKALITPTPGSPSGAELAQSIRGVPERLRSSNSQQLQVELGGGECASGRGWNWAYDPDLEVGGEASKDGALRRRSVLLGLGRHRRRGCGRSNLGWLGFLGGERRVGSCGCRSSREMNTDSRLLGWAGLWDERWIEVMWGEVFFSFSTRFYVCNLSERFRARLVLF